MSSMRHPEHAPFRGEDLARRQDGTPATAVFVLDGVHVRYGPVHALRDARLSIRAGEKVALVGANGSGKSTLLRVLHGLARPSAGLARCLPTTRQAMLFQHPYMLRTSVLNNVALGLWLRGTPWREARQRAALALEQVEMRELAGRNARGLSGGQKQRLALARAWAQAPEALLLDEPTASLDPHSKREVERLMQVFSASHGATMVFASHNLGQVQRLADRVVYLDHGRILADLPVHDFFNGPLPEPASLFLKGERIL
ncbi:phosphate ABC transporter ATP-binding protein [Bordetella genomosp. 13]|uniref:Phosphate ABC transporter ATP-binding protein n=2 Tax=Bordetella genomosp. 13 TaxID=463040 RepID=A0A1W6Z6V1_9BORD|nr:phosphate ABC transporter ATP-binding protein [Bordetella genomosp. 13]ARP93156.1 phosphate ABC transporter ATP-binding protein [Bordetella genomosp. 13]